MRSRTFKRRYFASFAVLFALAFAYSAFTHDWLAAGLAYFLGLVCLVGSEKAGHWLF